MREFTYEELVQYRPTGRDCNWQFPIRKSRKVKTKMKFKDIPSESAGTFLKIKPGESIVGIFRGEPHDYRTHWVNNRSQECTGDGCDNCGQGVKSAFKFRINFMVKEGNAYVAKIWEQGARVYNSLKALSADYNLEETVVKISRQGSGKDDTVYSVLPLPPPKGSLSKEALSAIKDVKLHDLVNPIDDSESHHGSDMDVPF